VRVISGEVTLSVLDWWKLGRTAYDELHSPAESGLSNEGQKIVVPRRENARTGRPPPIGPEQLKPIVIAADPYTAEAYRLRTGLVCSSLSFRDIAEGSMPEGIPRALGDSGFNEDTEPLSEDHSSPTSRVIDMVICSFALHLIETSSELFALLWELSTKSRWLVILAPHKKPDIKDGWGWTKWNVATWSDCPMSDSKGELLQERVHCRIYRSLNF